MKNNILVTGGAGYIGSHTVLELLNANYNITVLDNLSNSSALSLERVQEITGKSLEFINGDITDESLLEEVFESKCFSAVLHFAGLKSVSESTLEPLTYYKNNIKGTLSLLEAMDKAKCRNFVFSSSATVYGNQEKLPIAENSSRSVINPYGRSKLVIEKILEDIQKANSEWKIINLRYFNPVGAHSSGLIGENPLGKPNNLMPYIVEVASGKKEFLSIYGNDYLTKDGTGIRDYIHVVDLALGHLSALEYLLNKTDGEILAINLGTGNGISVLEMVKMFEKISGKKVPYIFTDRRNGDVAACYADVTKAREILNWKASLDLENMCKDTWNWQSKNPLGYLN